jgi:hypothetical protein
VHTARRWAQRLKKIILLIFYINIIYTKKYKKVKNANLSIFFLLTIFPKGKKQPWALGDFNLIKNKIQKIVKNVNFIDFSIFKIYQFSIGKKTSDISGAGGRAAQLRLSASSSYHYLLPLLHRLHGGRPP